MVSLRYKKGKKISFFLTALRWLCWQMLALLIVSIALVILFRFIPPPQGIYMNTEARRLALSNITRDWQDLETFPRNVPLAIVAAEDAHFCTHYGFDIESIVAAWDGGAKRGASTLSQQVAKNVFLWQGRSWPRKGLEVGFTLLIEVFWSKARILEVYINVAELDAGVFGISSGAAHYFKVAPDKITQLQAARLAAILPNPKKRSASKPTNFVRNKTKRVLSGMATLEAEGRAECF